MPSVSVQSGGTWYTAKEIFVNSVGTWYPIKGVWFNNGGTWQQVFPDTAPATPSLWTTPGTYYYTVPNGVYALITTIYGGGGGASNAAWSGYYGEFHGGAGAGSNGQVISTIAAVTPGQVVTLTVGAGGSQAQGTGNGSSGYPGTNSSFGSIVAAGGAGGVYGAGGSSPYQIYGQGGNYVSNAYGANQPGNAGAVSVTW